MRRSRSHACAALVLLLLAALFTPVSRARADSLEDRLQDTQTQLNNLKTEGARTRALLKEVEDRAEQTRTAYQKSVADLAAARTALTAANQRVTAAEADLQRAEAELKARTDQLEDLRKALANRVRTIYMEGQVEYIEVLFAAASFSDFLNRYEFLRLIVNRDSRLVQEFNALQQAAAAQRAATQRQRDEMVRLRNEASAQEQAVAQFVSATQRLQSDLAVQKRTLEQRVDELNRRSEQLNGIILELQRELARRAGKLDMRFPVDQVRITDGFGMRWHPILDTYKMHYGTDFAVNYGTPIYATEDGRVLIATWDDAYGNYVVIDHGETQGKLVSTLYAHNSTLLVKAGQEVKRGQVIARAGSTGWSTGPHSHFEVRVNGVPQQPLDWLPK